VNAGHEVVESGEGAEVYGHILPVVADGKGELFTETSVCDAMEDWLKCKM
jgi:hypothetical protein